MTLPSIRMSVVRSGYLDCNSLNTHVREMTSISTHDVKPFKSVCITTSTAIPPTVCTVFLRCPLRDLLEDVSDLVNSWRPFTQHTPGSMPTDTFGKRALLSRLLYSKEQDVEHKFSSVVEKFSRSLRAPI